MSFVPLIHVKLTASTLKQLKQLERAGETRLARNFEASARILMANSVGLAVAALQSKVPLRSGQLRSSMSVEAKVLAYGGKSIENAVQGVDVGINDAVHTKKNIIGLTPKFRPPNVESLDKGNKTRVSSRALRNSELAFLLDTGGVGASRATKKRFKSEVREQIASKRNLSGLKVTPIRGSFPAFLDETFRQKQQYEINQAVENFYQKARPGILGKKFEWNEALQKDIQVGGVENLSSIDKLNEDRRTARAKKQEELDEKKKKQVERHIKKLEKAEEESSYAISNISRKLKEYQENLAGYSEKDRQLILSHIPAIQARIKEAQEKHDKIVKELEAAKNRQSGLNKKTLAKYIGGPGKKQFISKAVDIYGDQELNKRKADEAYRNSYYRLSKDKINREDAIRKSRQLSREHAKVEKEIERLEKKVREHQEKAKISLAKGDQSATSYHYNNLREARYILRQATVKSRGISKSRKSLIKSLRAGDFRRSRDSIAEYPFAAKHRGEQTRGWIKEAQDDYKKALAKLKLRGQTGLARSSSAIPNSSLVALNRFEKVSEYSLEQVASAFSKTRFTQKELTELGFSTGSKAVVGDLSGYSDIESLI